MSRRDSAAIVPNTSELLPDPDTPVKTVRRRFGSSMLTSLRLFSRAPWTLIRSWLSAGVLIVSPCDPLIACSIQPCASDSPALPLEPVRVGEGARVRGDRETVRAVAVLRHSGVLGQRLAAVQGQLHARGRGVELDVLAAEAARDGEPAL